MKKETKREQQARVKVEKRERKRLSLDQEEDEEEDVEDEDKYSPYEPRSSRRSTVPEQVTIISIAYFQKSRGLPPM